jgi:hypothetical protein
MMSRRPTGDSATPGEVYFEFTAIGATVKVAAIDAANGVEVSVVGPANAARADLERLALQKLKARLARGGEPG